MAGELGISLSAVSRALNGRRRNMSITFEGYFKHKKAT